MVSLGLILVAALVIVYDVLGIIFLIKDHDVVHTCHASDEDVHAIWSTNLWMYCLISVILGSLLAIMLTRAPWARSKDAIELHVSKLRGGKLSKGRIDSTPMSDDALGGRTKFGLTPNLPDWLFLGVGSCCLLVAGVLGILAFWGYVELFQARPHCSDIRVAFEELHLWHFGRVTFFIQLVMSIMLAVIGSVCWAIPFLLELSLPDPQVKVQFHPGQGPYGAAQGRPGPLADQMVP
eukprot:gnl/MRDRNA2_/MRDRNA2_94759_c0_seq1.p1 gnl/MRDRNA2_/MRDRNA2_94759_c0~~gnl/MRDRNA2_/MRDRNA2_94759_c0_seq1.p1  ORF type:complete len:236 (+),score=13.71 gnl/MRDRNA2_/MRDRNA2_94759_c0_seq1:140-847(+)